MKTRKALSLFFCTVAFAAGAATVSVDTVKFAAGSWALSNASLGVPHGKTVSGATPYDVDGAVGFYAVALEGGGTVFLAADDEIGPVIGFTSSSEPDLTEGSPLRILLEKDIAARRGVLAADAAAAKKKTAQLSSSSSSVSSSAASPAKILWAALAPSGQSDPKMLMASASPRAVDAISDIRVPQLVQSLWSQTEDDNGNPCYNYHTPNNYPSGCTATAAGQIMRYWNYPWQELPSITRTCTVNNSETNLTTLGESRIYDWAKMKYDPNAFSIVDEREAIGHLLSDIGIALSSDYTKKGTGADPQVLGSLYQDDYEYASGVMYWNESGWDTGVGGLHTRELRNKIIYANLDAKRPVQFAIYGYDSDGRWAGHAVVCDGYGFVTIGGVETEFAHVNMGWAGTDDMWYNIPEINAANSGAYVGQSGIDFMYLGGAAYNIHPTETGDLLTGRVVEDEEPVSGAAVELRDSTGAAIATTTTDKYGVYYFSVVGGATYDVYAVSGDGTKSGLADDVYLPATVEDASTGFAHNVTKAANVGNSWGNDIDIVIPHVRIVGKNDYPSLSAALGAAAAMENPVIEIFGPTLLKRPVTITTNVTIRTVPDTSADYPVAPSLAECVVVATDDTITKEEWVLQVADGVRVDFSNIVIRTEANAPVTIDVLETGKAAFSGRVDLGTVTTHAADAFILAGPLEPVGSGLAVSCPEASGFGLQFGTYECSYEMATSYAHLIANALDATLTGAVRGGDLVWDRQPIDPSIAVAYATNDVFGIKYYSSVDLLFSDYADGAEVVFLKDCPASMFTNAVVVGKSMTIRSKADTPVAVTLGKDASFTVQGEDTELVFTNIVFKRTGTPSTNFATVNGGASLVLASGATIADLQLAGTASAVYVDSGKVTMLDGSAITNCVMTGTEGKAGGVYLKGAGCAFDFAGGLITACKAGSNSGGGAVYGEGSAKVYVSGSATAHGNLAGRNNNKRNINVYKYEDMILSGGLTGGKIGVYCRHQGYTSGKSFATVSNVVSAADAELSSGHFSNDYDANLSAKPSDGGTMLVWAAEPPGPKPVPEAYAEARLIIGSETNTYATVGDAFEAAGVSDARIELVTNASLTSNITVSSAIIFDGKRYTLSRAGDFYLAVQGADASLTVTNIVIYGGSGAGRVLNVYGGSLVLEADTVISNVNGSANTMVAPIVVDQNGTLAMLPGSEISDCKNSFARWSGGPLAAGAVVATGNSCVRIYGGSIHNCSGSGAGGVYIGNTSCAYVQGDISIRNNTSLSGEPSNMVVHDKSVLVLDDMLAGLIGYTEGVGGDTNVFGTIDSDFVASTTASNVAVSARCFKHDLTGAKGMVATNETEAILVWSSAVGDSDMFTNVVGSVTNVYGVIRIDGDDEPEVVVCEPFAFVSIEEVTPGTWKLTLTNGTEYCVYTLFGSADLKNWSEAGKKNPLAGGDISGADHEFVFEVDDSSGTQFWKVEGEDGTKNP